MNARPIFLTLLALAMLLPGLAGAFEIFGYHSGMSKKEAAAHSAMLGLDSWPGPRNALAVGNARDARMDIALGFCGHALVSYHRAIASDGEYFATLKELGERYGPPSSVKASGGGEWSAWGDTAFQSAFVMAWQRGGDRIALTTYPEGRMEWRNGSGGLRHARPPRLDFVTPNPCGE